MDDDLDRCETCGYRARLDTALRRGDASPVCATSPWRDFCYVRGEPISLEESLWCLHWVHYDLVDYETNPPLRGAEGGAAL
jgi:hypothetical protein